MKKLILYLFLVTLPVFAGDEKPSVEGDIKRGIPEDSLAGESNKKTIVDKRFRERVIWDVSGAALGFTGLGLLITGSATEPMVPFSGLVAGIGMGILVRSCFNAWTGKESDAEISLEVEVKRD